MATASTNLGLNSHFDWNLDPDGTKDTQSVIHQIKIHLVDQTNMTVPALLFKAYLYMSDYAQPSKDPTISFEALDDAESAIRDMENEEAKTGLLIVHHSLAAIICGQQKEDSDEKRRYIQETSHLENQKTRISDAHINATRAFALSRLGPARINECIDYFQKAINVSNDNIEWLLYLGIMYGRKARGTEGIRNKETEYTRKERGMYEKVLKIDPNHAVANVFLGQVLFHEGKRRDATSYIETALRLAPDNKRVLNRSARFYRKTFNWSEALECINRAIGLTRTDPDGMLFHQLALIYIGKYKGIVGGKQRRSVPKLHGETNDPNSLLHPALRAIDEAIELSDSVLFGYDRAWILEKMGQCDEAEIQYKKLVDRMHPDKQQDSVQTLIKYGNFLLKRRPNDAMDLLKKGIEIAVAKCTEMTEGNAQRFQGNIGWLIEEAIQTYKIYNENKILAGERDPVAFKNLGWLKLILGNMKTAGLKSALYYYTKAHEYMRQDRDESIATEILQGLIDCHIKNGQEEDLNQARVYIQELMERNEEDGRRKLADLRVSEGN